MTTGFLTRARSLFAVCTLALVGAAATAGPRSDFHPNALELVRLPKYCQGQFRPEMAKDAAYRMPACGGRFNHFCPALVSLNRVEFPFGTDAPRDFHLKNAAGHLKYTTDAMPVSCPLSGAVRAAETRLRILQMMPAR